MGYQFKYELLDGFDYEVMSVILTDIDKSESVPVQTTDAKSSVTYQVNDPKEVIEFRVKLQAVDTDSGKELLQQVPELVKGPLKDDYEAKPAKVMWLKKDSETIEEEQDIQNCVIKSASITTDQGKPIGVEFQMIGFRYE